MARAYSDFSEQAETPAAGPSRLVFGGRLGAHDGLIALDVATGNLAPFAPSFAYSDFRLANGFYDPAQGLLYWSTNALSQCVKLTPGGVIDSYQPVQTLSGTFLAKNLAGAPIQGGQYRAVDTTQSANSTLRGIFFDNFATGLYTKVAGLDTQSVGVIGSTVYYGPQAGGLRSFTHGNFAGTDASLGLPFSAWKIDDGAGDGWLYVSTIDSMYRYNVVSGASDYIGAWGFTLHTDDEICVDSVAGIVYCQNDSSIKVMDFSGTVTSMVLSASFTRGHGAALIP